jgi:hypothetical protein
VFGKNVHHRNLVVIEDMLDVGLQCVGHVAILCRWSNALFITPALLAQVVPVPT